MIQPLNEHSTIAIKVGTAVANRLADLMPALQQHLYAGGDPRGLEVRISLRCGGPGEAPVVAEADFSVFSGDHESWPVAPSAQTGQLCLMESITAPPGLNGGEPAQYPAQQAMPNPPVQQLVPRAERTPLPAPNYGGEMIAPPVSELTAPLIPQEAPIYPPATPQFQQPGYVPQFQPVPQQQVQQQPVPVPAPAPAAAPLRLKRPPMLGEENIS